MSLVVSPVLYAVASEEFEGCWIHDPGGVPRPSILMAPDWMGIGESAVTMAKAIAGSRYAVFIADMYGAKKRPKSVEEAIGLSGPLKQNPAVARRRISTAFEIMKANPAAGIRSDTRHAAIGFCFGGLNVLELARTGAELALTVSIHGELTTQHSAQEGAIKGEVLVLHGAADPVSPKAQRDAFEEEMEQAKIKWRMITFGGVLHSFTDPGAAVAGIAEFDEAAADWTMAILSRALDKAI